MPDSGLPTGRVVTVTVCPRWWSRSWRATLLNWLPTSALYSRRHGQCQGCDGSLDVLAH